MNMKSTFRLGVENLKKLQTMTKHKILYFSFLLTFNEHIHLGPNELFRVFLDVWKHN